MLFRLILLLTVVPLVEFYLLWQLTELTQSLALTIGIIILTGVVGASLARMEGLRVLSRLQEELNRGKLPPGSIMDGVMILVAAALLVTPGLLTDAFGFFLLIPHGRSMLKGVLKKWLQKKLQDGTIRFHSSGWQSPRPYEPPRQADELTEEGESERED